MPNRDKEKQKEYNKAYYQAHKEDIKAYNKSYKKAHKEEIKDYNKAYMKAYLKADTNSLGQAKDYIRQKSSRYLFNVLKHNKISGYEIHHCFGYDDYRNFIYIPKSLHLQIHQYLRDNHIDADTDHYNQIVHLIIACEEYVYIKA